eukprot:gnl/TRDRNA2_/TRDRNA2_133395_c4_seq1.p1 gnl/TRDRNA2_/TRDRNA2_133395_c4~~gnl/TRDRNA2_/TRDRNA2_133395_c4_seq1.p1  ORF type:complete len:699 (-),score=94.49 gnl/TRDRNA2_/TRDRNA2_133395_c4_seq1:454-2460(-)
MVAATTITNLITTTTASSTTTIIPTMTLAMWDTTTTTKRTTTSTTTSTAKTVTMITIATFTMTTTPEATVITTTGVKFTTVATTRTLITTPMPVHVTTTATMAQSTTARLATRGTAMGIRERPREAVQSRLSGAIDADQRDQEALRTLTERLDWMAKMAAEMKEADNKQAVLERLRMAPKLQKWQQGLLTDYSLETFELLQKHFNHQRTLLEGRIRRASTSNLAPTATINRDQCFYAHAEKQDILQQLKKVNKDLDWLDRLETEMKDERDCRAEASQLEKLRKITWLELWQKELLDNFTGEAVDCARRKLETTKIRLERLTTEQSSMDDEEADPTTKKMTTETITTSTAASTTTTMMTTTTAVVRISAPITTMPRTTTSPTEASTRGFASTTATTAAGTTIKRVSTTSSKRPTSTSTSFKRRSAFNRMEATTEMALQPSGSSTSHTAYHAIRGYQAFSMPSCDDSLQSDRLRTTAQATVKIKETITTTTPTTTTATTTKTTTTAAAAKTTTATIHAVVTTLEDTTTIRRRPTIALAGLNRLQASMQEASRDRPDAVFARLMRSEGPGNASLTPSADGQGSSQSRRFSVLDRREHHQAEYRAVTSGRQGDARGSCCEYCSELLSESHPDVVSLPAAVIMCLSVGSGAALRFICAGRGSTAAREEPLLAG